MAEGKEDLLEVLVVVVHDDEYRAVLLDFLEQVFNTLLEVFPRQSDAFPELIFL